MKHSKFITSILLGAVTLSLGAVLAFSKTTAKVNAEATIVETSLPSTMNIKLSDTSNNDIRSYYSSLNSLSTSERSGTNLLKNLKPILQSGATYYSYANVTNIVGIVDRDWVNSPANKISSTYGTYNSSTNTINNYKITQSRSENPYIHMLYVDYTIQPKTLMKNTTSTSVSFDKEHIWPKSMGFKDGSNEYPGAFTDIHHLTSGDPDINQNEHGNYSYGIVNGNSTHTPTNLSNRQGSSFDVSCLNGNKIGTALNKHSGDSSTTVFEPQDADKGRIARAVLYMAARYNNYASTSGEIGYYEPNLAVVNKITSTGMNVVAPSETSPAGIGILQDLLYWNKMFPPDEWEIHRNNLVYNNFQHNRNPFIDFPEWADYIWGTTTYSGGKYTYSSTTTGYAKPSTDTINGYNVIDNPVEDYVSLDKTSLTLSVGESATINASSSGSVTWTSSNSSIVSVSSNGNTATLTANAVGSSIISAKVGTATSTCNVTVQSPTHIDVEDELANKSWPYISDVAYYMSLNNTGSGTNAGRHYFIGSMSGYYGATSTSKSDGVPMYFEDSGSNHYLYFLSGSTKNYITVTASGSYVNFGISTSTKTPFTYDSTLKTIVTDVSGTSYGLGTYSNYNTFGTAKTSYTTNYFTEFEYVNDNTAFTFAANFLTNLTCDASGNTSPSKSVWTSLKAEYDSLETGWKNYLKNASSNQTGNNSEKCVARYDYIISKYGASNYSNFMDRSINNAVANFKTNYINNNELLIIILIVGSITLMGPAYIIIKKKQH